MGHKKVLIVDDDATFLAALSELLTGEGYEVTLAGSSEEAIDRLRQDTFHLVLCDLQLPGRSGISLIKSVTESCPATASVLITAHGSIRSAVTALKRGAIEYMTKPIKPRRLLTLCRALTADPPAFLPNKLLVTDRSDAVHFDGMVARSRAMQAVFGRIELAARSDTTVLIVGESGTGKERVARSIHQRSGRSAAPFVAVQTGTFARELLATEIFGYERATQQPGGIAERGVGQLELAEGGTLFIDEVAALDDRAQVSLLRLLETGRFARVGGRKDRPANVRVIAASTRDLRQLVTRGELRADLVYRLDIFTVELPPLRERVEDIPALASELLGEFATRHGRETSGNIPPETQRLLAGYAWPGNVRELRNVLEQAVLVARRPSLEPSLLPDALQRGPSRAELIKIPIGTPMEAVEREVILRTLAAHEGNKTATAEALGISRRSIYNKLAEYGDKSASEPDN